MYKTAVQIMNIWLRFTIEKIPKPNSIRLIYKLFEALKKIREHYCKTIFLDNTGL